MSAPSGYELTNGQILKNGAAIASWNEDTSSITWIGDTSNLRPAVTRFLKAEYSPDVAINYPPKERPPEPVTATAEPEEEEISEVASVEIPPMPKYDPRMGDKTPAVVVWYQKYHHAEFLKRYRVVDEENKIAMRKLPGWTKAARSRHDEKYDWSVFDKK